MTLQQILYALTIEECGSMNKAAEKLYIVQPTLTSAIRELEKEVGITIFLRTRKGITPTPEGREFLSDIRNLYNHYSVVQHKYEDEGSYKNKFGVSTQHYSFAVKAFVEMAKRYDMREFDLCIRETRTRDVVMDVGSLRSEIGVLYMSNMNRKVINKLMAEQELEFHPLIRCRAYVYLWGKHPLAKEKTISIEQLEPYPCLSFEQDDNASYLAEEILSENIYPRTVKVTDRSTMLNLMVGLNGYTLCSGIISGDLNGEGYVVIPFKEDAENPNSIMQIGYITKANSVLSRMGEEYINELYRCIPVIEDISKRRDDEMAELDFAVDETLDITDVVCPVTFVKTKVALEELDEGQVLQVHLNDGEPVQNVPRSVKDEGHQILRLIGNEDGTYDLYIRKVGD